MVSLLASKPSCPGFYSQCSQNSFRGKNVDVAVLIDGAAWRKVDSSLKMSIEHIWYWLVASQYYKKSFYSVKGYGIKIQQCHEVLTYVELS